MEINASLSPPEAVSPIVPKHQVNLFFSVDLVNATNFKAKYPSKWVSVFVSFYELVSAAVKTAYHQETMVWKINGDEILFHFNIKDLGDVLKAPSELYKAMNGAQGDLFAKFSNMTKNHLYLQGALWIAATTNVNETQKGSPRNIRGEFLEAHSGNVDFLGADIDEGFRMATYTSQGKIVIDPKIAYLLNENEPDWVHLTSDAKAKEKVKIVDYKILKGIWGGHPFPIIWYAPNWDIDKLFHYDERHTSELAKAYILSKEESHALGNIKATFRELKFPLERIKQIEVIINNRTEENPFAKPRA